MIDSIKENQSFHLQLKQTAYKQQGKFIYNRQCSNSAQNSPTSRSMKSSQFSNKHNRSCSSFLKSANAYEGSAMGLYNNDSVWGQSSATWRQTSLSYGFPKSNRFGGSSNPYNKLKLQTNLHENSDLTLNLPSTKTSRTCTLGKGEKQIIPVYQQRNAKNNPSPGHVTEVFTYPKNVKNISMGTQFRFFKQQQKNPGPGTYEVVKQPGKDKKQFSLKSRVQDTHKKMLDLQQLAPCHYNPKENLILNQKFSRITFGKGNKTEFYNKAVLGFPGPIYNLPSSFDKFNKATKNWVSPSQKKEDLIRQQQLQKIKSRSPEANNTQNVNRKRKPNGHTQSTHVNPSVYDQKKNNYM